MTREDKERLIALYETRYAELGYDPRTLGWHGQADQELRFKVLCDIADLSGKTICDVGCGFGDLARYLEGRFVDTTYIGFDLAPSLIERARRLHPDREFRQIDILADDFVEEVDYFLISGALNFRVADNWKLTTRMLTLMFERARLGVAVNFLSTYVNYEQPHNYHHNPEKVFAFARSLTRWVTLRHNYPLWEFTIYLYKNAQAGEEGLEAGAAISALSA